MDLQLQHIQEQNLRNLSSKINKTFSQEQLRGNP